MEELLSFYTASYYFSRTEFLVVIQLVCARWVMQTSGDFFFSLEMAKFQHCITCIIQKLDNRQVKWHIIKICFLYKMLFLV